MHETDPLDSLLGRVGVVDGGTEAAQGPGPFRDQSSDARRQRRVRLAGDLPTRGDGLDPLEQGLGDVPASERRAIGDGLEVPAMTVLAENLSKLAIDAFPLQLSPEWETKTSARMVCGKLPGTPFALICEAATATRSFRLVRAAIRSRHWQVHRNGSGFLPCCPRRRGLPSTIRRYARRPRRLGDEMSAGGAGSDNEHVLGPTGRRPDLVSAVDRLQTLVAVQQDP